MEYLKGQSLAARAQGRPMAVEVVQGVMLQVGAALMAAHKAGVVHRDLKPENIFLVPTALGDQVKVLDFGISKLSDSNMTTDSVLIGTPLYMPPEQALGNNRDIGPQSDLFSLGSITYELLTGEAPFLTDNIARVVFRIAYEKHTPLAKVRADLPPNVVQAVEHALEKEKDKRTPDISGFVRELTGTSLVEVTEESSGVFTSRLGVSDSMISGETRNASERATPAPSSTPPNSLPQPSRLSGKTYVITVVSAVLIIGAIVSKVRMDNWKERAAYRAQMVDAGWVMLADGNFVRDAGEGDAGVDAGLRDAGTSDAGTVDAGTVDAGRLQTGTPDAGAAETVRMVKDPPLTADEQRQLGGLREQQLAGRWEIIWEARGTLRVAMKTATPGARKQLFEVVLEAACQRRDLDGVKGLTSDARQLFGPQAQRLRQRCEQVYPDSANLDW
jgi:hypothetical protein